MRKYENQGEKIARYFWGSVLALTMLIVLDVVSGLGLTSAVFKFFFPGKVISYTEPLNVPLLISRRQEDVIIPATMNDSFSDLKAFVDNPVPEKFRHIIKDFNFGANPTMREILNITKDQEKNSLDYFQNGISQHEMYPEDDKIVQRVLQKIATQPFRSVYEKPGGTQLKLIIKFIGGYRALFKPMRTPREQQTPINHFYFNDYERHNGEIASYHLDKVLGFRRAIPMVGRRFNITSDLLPYGNDDFVSTFYTSPSGKVCFTGQCDVFCDTNHPVCGDPYMLEGSFAAFLPKNKNARRKSWRHPWRRSYSKRRTVDPQHDPGYCDKVRQVPPYDRGRRMLDIMDMCIYDFLIGNEDRHHYETFKTFDKDNTFTIHLDQGRSFGLPFHDEHSILMPLEQCCEIRKSTLETLLKFHNGPVKLSEALRESLKSEPLENLLWEPHYQAIDRRVPIILEYVRNCVKRADQA